MKIILDIPDNTVAMTVVLLSGNWAGLTMHNEGIPQRKLTDGAEIKIDVKKGEGE